MFNTQYLDKYEFGILLSTYFGGMLYAGVLSNALLTTTFHWPSGDIRTLSITTLGPKVVNPTPPS